MKIRRFWASATFASSSSASFQPICLKRNDCIRVFSTRSRNKVESQKTATFAPTPTSHADPSSPAASRSPPPPRPPPPPMAWYPTRIQETIDYHQLVSRLYLRHIVTETKGMALAAMQLYQSNEKDVDPFGIVAASLSACIATRHEGGRIGWIERTVGGEYDHDNVLDASLVTQVYDRQPKAGDLCLLQSTKTSQWHVILVAELWMMPFAASATNDKIMHNTTEKDGGRRRQLRMLGSHAGMNAILPPRTLKGQGVIPRLPPHMTTYTIQTAGCQMNVADSERLAGVLENKNGLNMRPAESFDDQAPDVIIFNTCSIRDHAEQKLYDALGPYAALKRKKGNNKQMAIVVTGCVAQQEGEALLRRVPEIDVVIGPQYVPYLQTVLESVINNGQQVVATAPMLIQDDLGWNKPIRGHDVRAWVNVIYGCNEHCTYCVVPGTRGLEQSRTMEGILLECLELADAGYKEVTLLGQNIDAYGRDMVPKRTFADLLVFLNDRISSKMRLRYVTSHPRYFSDRVIDAVAGLDKVCECFHVPFQAGDDTVLRRMRRGYTFDSYMRIIDKIRAAAPDCAICGDVIVGFPGETEAAFQKTLDLMRLVKFDNLNSFAYSPRPNTEAGTWEDQVSEKVKAERLQRVQKLAAEHGQERSQRYLNRTVEVLVEDANPRNPLQVMGRTRQGRQVYFDGDLKALKGQFINVRITEARVWSLMGIMV